MQKKQLKKLLSLIVCIVLVAAIALFTTACSDSKDSKSPYETVQLDGGDLGEGKLKFTFIVRDVGGEETTFQIKTDEDTVGAALKELKLIAGDEEEYGIYVKKVNGLQYSYEEDGKYWAFYEGDTASVTGVDQVKITDGATYSFRAE